MKSIENAIDIIKTNSDFIDRILVSEDFMLKLIPYSGKIKIESKTIRISESDLAEQFYLFDIPLIYSNILLKDAIMEMKSGESVILQGYNQNVLTCPHCGKTGASGAMKRWHFDNCKEKNV